MNYPFPASHYQRDLAPPDHHFNTIVGHETVKRMIWNMIQTGRLPNSILIRGPEGVGKRSIAFAAAKLINGEPSDISDAAPSRAARNIATGDYVDLKVIGPSGPAGQIKIERGKNDPPEVWGIREASDWAFITPIEARKKIILIHDAQRMNVPAANCFLKTLEEPPAHCLIILTTAMPHALLPTIRSRCSAIHLHPVPQGELVQWLMAAFGMEEDQAAMAALLGEGRPGQALKQLATIRRGKVDEEADLWTQVAQSGEEACGVDAKTRSAVAGALDRFYQHGFVSTFGVANELCALGGSLEAALALMLMWYRDLAIRALAGAGSPLLVNRDLIEKGAWPNTPTSATTLGRSLHAIIETLNDAKRPFLDAQLAMENLLIRLGEMGR